MFRLILLILFIAAIVTTALAMLAVMQSVAGLARSTGEDNMPGTFQRIAYILLVLLLIGLTTGWLGGV
ncbi:hypothetical protein [Yoonia sp. R2-816]|uniref:hypothetical protein n=1 Tax=Yoonia sp. R2-816 TaxID=3342638 RepID=UPI00372CC16F